MLRTPRRLQRVRGPAVATTIHWFQSHPEGCRQHTGQYIRGTISRRLSSQWTMPIWFRPIPAFPRIQQRFSAVFPLGSGRKHAFRKEAWDDQIAHKSVLLITSVASHNTDATHIVCVCQSGPLKPTKRAKNTNDIYSNCPHSLNALVLCFAVFTRIMDALA